MGYPSEAISLILRALTFVAEKHQHHRRKNKAASPYINHLIAVTDVLWEVGQVRDIPTIVAGILHDSIEDTATSSEELLKEFGEHICHIVKEVTDDKTLSRQERKRRQIERASDVSPEARQIKLADKICNISDLADSPPVNWSWQRRLDYVNWAEHVINELRGTNPHLEGYFDEKCRKVREQLTKENE